MLIVVSVVVFIITCSIFIPRVIYYRKVIDMNRGLQGEIYVSILNDKIFAMFSRLQSLDTNDTKEPYRAFHEKLSDISSELLYVNENDTEKLDKLTDEVIALDNQINSLIKLSKTLNNYTSLNLGEDEPT